MPPALLLAGLIGIVAYGLARRGGVPGHVAALVRDGSRRRRVAGWAAGTFVAYGLSALVALALLGRLDAVAVFPVELLAGAYAFGLPGRADAATIAWLGGCIAAGTGAAIVLLLVLRWRRIAPIGLRYRSPAAMRAPGEWPASLAVALAAGFGEELFFRLALPLVAAIALGSATAGIAIGFVAFVALHRHQGVAGVVAVAVVGVALTYLYLLTGALWFVIALHVAIDVNALIVRPLVTAPLRT